MPGFWLSKVEMIPLRAPAGSSGSHHWENEIVTTFDAAWAGAVYPNAIAAVEMSAKIATLRDFRSLLLEFPIFPPMS
jgi:hypothetical protein